MFCLMNCSNRISLKCIFSIGLLTILYCTALFRTVDMMLRALYTQLWQKKQWMKYKNIFQRIQIPSLEKLLKY